MKPPQDSGSISHVKKQNSTSKTEIRQKLLKYLFLETPCRILFVFLPKKVPFFCPYFYKNEPVWRIGHTALPDFSLNPSIRQLLFDVEDGSFAASHKSSRRLLEFSHQFSGEIPAVPAAVSAAYHTIVATFKCRSVRSYEVGLGPNAQLVFGAYIAELTIIVPVRSEHSKRLIVKNGPVSAHCLCDCRHIWSWIPRICCRWWHLSQFCPKTLERR